MKVKTLLVLLILPFFSKAQSFQELCESEVINGTIVQFEYFQEEIYATGFFNQICGNSISYLAKWNGDGWDAVSDGLTDPGHSLFPAGDTLFLAKYEESIDSNWVYIYTGGAISKFGPGVYLSTASGFSELPNIYDITRFQGQIIACGEFDRVGNQSISGIMAWNGSGWEALGNGLSGNIPNTAPVMFPHQLFVFEEELYVIGNFGQAGGITANGIAKWDGSQWQAVGNGFDGTVYAIGEYQGELFVGGAFEKNGTQSLDRLAKWDGNAWISPGFGFIPANNNDFAFVHTLKVIDEALHIAGGLKKIKYNDETTLDCGGIVSYDGNTLNTFNGGVTGNDIEAIIKRDSTTLMIGGGVFGSGYLGESVPLTSTQELLVSENLSVFPNPTSGNIQFIHQAANDPADVLVYSTEGKLVRSFSGVNLNESLDLSFIDPGVYFLKIKNDQQMGIVRLMIQ